MLDLQIAPLPVAVLRYAADNPSDFDPRFLQYLLRWAANEIERLQQSQAESLKSDGRPVKMSITLPDGKTEYPVVWGKCWPDKRGGQFRLDPSKPYPVLLGIRVQVHLESDGKTEGFLAIVESYWDKVFSFRRETAPESVSSAEPPVEEKKINFREWF